MSLVVLAKLISRGNNYRESYSIREVRKHTYGVVRRVARQFHSRALTELTF
jgi:hypothetical protein